MLGVLFRRALLLDLLIGFLLSGAFCLFRRARSFFFLLLAEFVHLRLCCGRLPLLLGQKNMAFQHIRLSTGWAGDEQGQHGCRGEQ
ncbi:hypothetical protein DUT91_01540 [Phyllobacterium salinisoli]|uniref:Uncharacterized protein n=1 Tax=Phyllobacterium salinisoli TaxID=1899321 RepID=A0A368K829_9HYPH|nr:hypothetical protein DUT91_01540 [Phyllobacterium salinisoli]